MKKILTFSVLLNIALGITFLFTINDKKSVEQTLIKEINRCNPSYFNKDHAVENGDPRSELLKQNDK